MTKVSVPSICRNCTAYCPITVTIENGRAVKVVGDREAPLFEGYTCPKGRELPAQHNHPKRLLRGLKRDTDGTFRAIASEDAICEIAAKVQNIIKESGPRSVAVYFGTGNVTNPNGAAMAKAWMNAIKSKMIFSATAIDKPAANVSVALHGNWVAGTHGFETSDTWMIVGANPVIAKSNGAPFNNPGRRLKEAVDRGLNLIVIDPRKTETAKRARVHLQGLPGEDPAILACIIRVIVEENLFDHNFVSENTVGLDALRAAVASYTPDYVSGRAGVAAEHLIEAARIFAQGKRGGVVCATGPSFSTNSNLTYYLGLCLNTLCGRWVRVGETAPYSNVLLPAFEPKAQPYPPFPARGEFAMRAFGLHENASGMPTAALPEEILQPGDGKIRALICFSGNPALSWPDQIKTERALKDLDLLVVLDHQMTATAKFASYVLPCPLSFETAGATTRIEALKYIGVARGYSQPWAHYTPKIIEPPEDSDLVEDGQFFFRLAQKMNLQLNWTNVYGFGKHVETPAKVIPLDMTRVPTTEEMIELTCSRSRVPLSKVKEYPHGHVFDEEGVIVQPRDPDCTAMLQLADPLMMQDLSRIYSEGPLHLEAGEATFLLISRRINNVMNSVGQSIEALNRGRRYAPAYMHPEDMARLKFNESDIVRIRSAHSEILAEIGSDSSLRTGLVAVVHGYSGEAENGRANFPLISGSVSRLISMDEFDPISGIPRMSALSVEIRAL
jgi:anaerobic selenocysteine-containing dehydrogenase